MAKLCTEKGLTKASHDDLEFVVRNVTHMIHGQLRVVFSLAVALSYQQASSLERRESHRQMIWKLE